VSAAPCHCDRLDGQECKPCRLARTDPRYRALWRGPAAPPPCVHLGPPTGERTLCTPCRGRSQLKLFRCAVHERCTPRTPTPGAACCVGCPDYADRDPFTSPPVRDLAYHVYPLTDHGGYVWRRRVAQLLRHIALFNGHRVIGVAEEPGRTDSARDVLAAFKGEVDASDVIVVWNDPSRWECSTLLPLLSRLETADPDRCLLWAHAKGVTRPPGHVCQHWADALGEVMLARWPAVEADLVRHRVTGAFRWRTRMWPDHSRADWFYSGSWFWARSRHLFARDWRRTDAFKWAAESYAPTHFAHAESGCLFADEAGNVYDQAQWERRFWPEWAAWLREEL
jgi:hypothetical protein